MVPPRHLTCLSIMFSFAAASAAMAGMIYEQNFDAVGQAALISTGAGHSAAIGTLLPGWSVTADGANQSNVTIGQGTKGGSGSVAGAYLATGDMGAAPDFNLSIYNTKSSGNFITCFTYTATTQVSGINGSFDYESAWSLYKSTTLRNGGFEAGLKYSVTQVGGPGMPTFVPATPTNVLGTTSFHVQNNLVTSTDKSVWLTDARMRDLGLSSRGLSFDLPGVTLNPGDTLTLKWEQNSTIDKNLAQGIDNFVLNGMVAPSGNNVPDGGATLALLCLGLTGLFGLRRQRAK